MAGGGLFGGTTPLSINTGGGGLFGQASQPSLFGAGLGQPQPAQTPGLQLAPFGQATPGQQVAAPGGACTCLWMCHLYAWLSLCAWEKGAPCSSRVECHPSLAAAASSCPAANSWTAGRSAGQAMQNPTRTSCQGLLLRGGSKAMLLVAQASIWGSIMLMVQPSVCRGGLQPLWDDAPAPAGGGPRGPQNRAGCQAPGQPGVPGADQDARHLLPPPAAHQHGLPLPRAEHFQVRGLAVRRGKSAIQGLHTRVWLSSADAHASFSSQHTCCYAHACCVVHPAVLTMPASKLSPSLAVL